ncbi:hypothetical protein, partial [Acinetobacter modestus]|uniref:hypothetical protein n=1 Tax=Acinetobacter modestus TaxID=1776740 RepID=UPI0030180BDE
PVGTSRVEVKYKLQGVSQWSTLTSSAALYNNISGWYQVNLSTLSSNQNYDYQYITYDSAGSILGGGQGVVNTAVNNASINQKSLSAEDMPSVYIDKSEVVNNNIDITSGILVDETKSNISFEPISPWWRTTQTVVVRYDMKNSILNQFPSKKFTLTINNNSVLNQVDFVVDNTKDYTSVEIKLLGSLTLGQNNIFVNIFNLMDGNQVSIGYGFNVFDCKYEDTPLPIDVISVTEIYSSVNFREGKKIYLTNQPNSTTKVLAYYRELGSKNPFFSLEGGSILNTFILNLDKSLDINKKYELVYISLAGNKIVNCQQGVIEFTSAGMQVNTSPLNYGGDGFILFSGTDISFIDQFKPVSSATTSAKLKIRKVGTTVWENFTLSSTSDWFNWSGGNSGRDGDYEFQLDSYNGTGLTTPSGS